MTRYYIEIPDGKVYFELNNFDIISEREIITDSYELNNIKLINPDLFKLFLTYYAWCKLEIKATSNGPFLFISLQDGYYGEPMFKVFMVYK
jgi:hypothetical protein